MSFANPEYLVFVLAIPLLWLVLARRSKLLVAKFPWVEHVGGSWSGQILFRLIAGIPTLVRSSVLFLLVLALARPQWGPREQQRSSEGIDIVLALDTSGSMRALDFTKDNDTLNRLDAVKTVVSEFVEQRPEDRIGLVVFGSDAFTQAPLTLDHRLLQSLLVRLRIGMAGDATAIGDAIATASNRVKDIEAKSRVVILLTDGRNTAGTIEPITAAKAAASVGVKVYTVGIGAKGKVPIPVETAFGQRIVYQESDLDEELLGQISTATNARFFRAYDNDDLHKVYATIDALEKKAVQVEEHRLRDEAYGGLVLLGVLLLAFETAFMATRLRRIP